MAFEKAALNQKKTGRMLLRLKERPIVELEGANSTLLMIT